MLVREHRGSLSDAMGTVCEIQPTYAALKSHIASVSYMPEDFFLKVEKYGMGIDHRIGWDTHIVTIDGYGVWGFTDGALRYCHD